MNRAARCKRRYNRSAFETPNWTVGWTTSPDERSLRGCNAWRCGFASLPLPKTCPRRTIFFAFVQLEWSNAPRVEDWVEHVLYRFWRQFSTRTFDMLRH